MDARTTTDLSEDVVLGKGVYSAEVDNVNKVINVVLARHTGGVWDATEYNQTTQDELGALIEVTPLEGATVDGVTPDRVTGTYEVGADNGDTFTVTSESGGNHSTYKVVATYKDAINSFSVDGVDGVISDVDKNDVPDTITVTLPKDAINDQWGYPVTNPKFAVKYKVEGNLHCTMEIYETNNGTALDSNLVSGDEVVFNDLANKTWTGSVRVYRLGSESSTIDTKGTDAIQVYNLVVRLQPDSDTEITYVRVDDTIADIEGNAINAVLPVNKDTGAPTEQDDLSVVIYTGTSVESVTVDGKPAAPITDKNDLDYDASRIAWKITGVNIETMKVITVVAEDSNTSEQYTITTEIAQRHDDASITHFSIGDYDGVITNSGGANTPDVITVTVPYMTLDVADLRVYATPSSGAKVQFGTGTTYDLINGYHTADRIGLGSEIDVTNGISTKIVAVDKNDETVRQEYVVNVVLDKPAATGNRLEGLHFTACHQ